MNRLFERRRGFRLMELVTVGCLVVIVLGVYLTKAAAGREGAKLAEVNAQIREEQRRVKLLRAELAYLEQPRRIERLAETYLALQPASAKRETQPAGLAEIARQPAPESLR
jgi:cell division protein FtsL